MNLKYNRKNYKSNLVEFSEMSKCYYITKNFIFFYNIITL